MRHFFLNPFTNENTSSTLYVNSMQNKLTDFYYVQIQQRWNFCPDGARQKKD